MGFDQTLESVFIMFQFQIIINTSIYYYYMPKYVPKEDVEKGLVDPSKSLNEQPEYKEKIQKETQDKQKNHEERKPKVQRPKKQRPARNARPIFNWNKNQITIQTKALDKPKKLLQKPDNEKHNEIVDKMRAQIAKLRDQKKALFDEQKHIIHDLIQSQKTGKIAITQFSGAAREKINVERALRKQIKTLDDAKVKLNDELKILQAKLDEYKRPYNKELLPLQYIKEQIQDKQHFLTTKSLDKRQQAKLLTEITQLKRALHKARPSHQIQSETIKIQDNIDILFKSLKKIKHELHIKITEDQVLKAEIDLITNQKKAEQGQVQEKKTVQEIRAEFDIKFKDVETKMFAIEDKIDDQYDKLLRARDNYEDQQDLLRYIAFVQNQVTYLKSRVQQQQKRKKEKEQREKKRKKQQQEWQKKQQERKLIQQQRKAKEQQRRIKKQKDRQAFINRNPNHQIIDLCQSLIEYCEGLKPSAVKYQPKERIQGEVVLGKEWNKEVKGGASIILSKKTKADEQAPKKAPKQKKKQEKAEDQGFTHGIQTINHFQLIQSLPPNSPAEIDASIKFIKEKIALYSTPTQEQIEAFKIKAAKQFDEKHTDRRENRQPRDQKYGENRDNKQHNRENRYKQKQHREGRQNRNDGRNDARDDQSEQKPKPKKRYERSNLTEQDFPGL